LCHCRNAFVLTSFSNAASRFLAWSRPSRCSALAPEAAWMMRTPFCLAFLCCPPGPPVQNVWISKSFFVRLNSRTLGFSLLLMDLLLDYDLFGRRRTLAGIAEDGVESDLDQDSDSGHTDKCRDRHGDGESDELPL